MTWKAKRLVGTALWATIPYFVWSFVALDWWSAFSTQDGRFCLSVLTIGAALISYTYPFWENEA